MSFYEEFCEQFKIGDLVTYEREGPFDLRRGRITQIDNQSGYVRLWATFQSAEEEFREMKGSGTHMEIYSWESVERKKFKKEYKEIRYEPGQNGDTDEDI